MDILDYALRAQGYTVRSTARGLEAVALCGQSPAPNLLILDVGLPDIDGFEVCRQVRRFSERLPILFLTSQGDEINRVVGLEIGGDDYVTKPFSPRELIARIKALRRRYHAPPETQPFPVAAPVGTNVLRYGPLEIDEEKFQARCGGSLLTLTKQEFRLLALLSGSPGRVFTREQVLDRAWEDGGAVTDRTIDAHIKSLRRKLTETGSDSIGEGLIETVRGVGYRARELL